MDARKEAICNALAAFVRQRPGLEWANYATSNHRESVAAYRADQRSIARDKRDAEALLLAVRHNDGITAGMMLEASRRAYSGRLTITEHLAAVDGYKGLRAGQYGAEIGYCTGQYFPTEYRRAVAAVCAAALWDWQRQQMPPMGTAPVGSGKAEAGMYWDARAGKSISAGDWLRRKFRETFGSAMQKRWFD